MLSDKDYNKIAALKIVIEAMEEVTMFSADEYLKGKGVDIEYVEDPIPYYQEVIEEFENNSDQSAEDFLRGEGYPEEEIHEILYNN